MDLGNFGWFCNKDSAPNHSSCGQGMAVNNFLSYRICQLRGIKTDLAEGEGTNHITISLYKPIMPLTVEYNAQLCSSPPKGYVNLEKSL